MTKNSFLAEVTFNLKKKKKGRIFLQHYAYDFLRDTTKIFHMMHIEIHDSC